MKMKELKLYADTISTGNGISEKEVFDAISETITQSVKRKNKVDKDAILEVNLSDEDDIEVVRKYKIVENVDNEDIEITLKMANDYVRESDGLFFIKEKENLFERIQFEFGRSDITIFKQLFITNLKTKVKKSVRNNFSDYFGSAIRCRIEGFDKRNIFVLFNGKEEGVLPKNNCLGNEWKTFKRGSYVDAILVDDTEYKNHKFVFTRKGAEFPKALITREVPEVETGVVKIDNIVRKNGVATFVLVSSADKTCMPMMCCIGRNGIRIKEINSSMNGEYIKIIDKNDNLINSIVDIIGAENVNDAVFDEDNNELTLCVPSDVKTNNIEMAKRLFSGENGLLKLSLTDGESNENNVKYLKDILDLDTDVIEFLIEIGFNNLTDISSLKDYLNNEDLLESLGEDNMLAISEMASQAMLSLYLSIDGSSFSDLELSNEVIYLLSNNGVKNKENLAELSSDELMEIVPFIERDLSDGIILGARENLGWFD